MLIIDASVLCVWLEVPGKSFCGPKKESWEKVRVEEKIRTETKTGTTFVPPLAAIIETGNHIAQSKQSRRERGEALADLMRKSADQETPGAALSDQARRWTPEALRSVADTWPGLAEQKLSPGDVTIKEVAEFYAQMGQAVEILTGDQGLKAYEPKAPVDVPRRGRRK